MKLLVLSVIALVAAGCTEKSSETPQPMKRHPMVTSAVIVPENVQGKWQAVKIAVLDKVHGTQKVYTIPLGGSLKIPGSDLTVTVVHFLPQFVMEGTALTSQSNEPKNPAAQLSITEDGKEIFRGWLFKLYPTTHAFQHPQYGLTLVDGIPKK